MKSRATVKVDRHPPASGEQGYTARRHVEITVVIDGTRGDPILGTVEKAWKGIEVALREALRS